MKFTINEFNDLYPDDEACLRDIVSKKEFVCSCGSHNLFLTPSRGMMTCKECLKTQSVLKGTVFYRSKVGLKSWYYAIYLMTKTKNGVSAKQLERELGVTYGTAFRMMHKIRGLMEEEYVDFTGTVEIDETYLGGKVTNRAWKYYAKKRGEYVEKKQIIFGILQRDGKLSTRVINNVYKDTILDLLRYHVRYGQTIYSDELSVYRRLCDYGFKHEITKHTSHFVRGDVHTNNIECFWSHLKRGLNGVYISVSDKYLPAYANEFAWRWNHRDLKDEMFFLLLEKAIEKAILPYSGVS